MDPLDLINACEHCYDYPQIKAGPDGRDGAAITQIDGRTVLVFRGTMTGGQLGEVFLDWINDLRVDLIPHADYPGRVHKGFSYSLENLRPWLSKYVFLNGLVITGHSKGGALALLAGHLYRSLAPEVITFGAPMVGDRGFQVGYSPHTTCYENPHDIVPRLPLLGYRTVGDLVSPNFAWKPPFGIQANHILDTGYRPWIQQLWPNGGGELQKAG
jgi:Lipase (class 3)